ncbi:unnamed protein product [Chondrus crispus]|uniref:Uncharacterized protein n=1 Tax=Chondrus crispus TaxID=2769 RepID=R7Q2V8_CHOCR|nr:unnamed protein product [Chondrus crispus]CDF32228.1 unnamed protein product [Chondrus crispus]|eukprot:XP_005711893.1 unnamed protein product [Chondrus crispus]
MLLHGKIGESQIVILSEQRLTHTSPRRSSRSHTLSLPFLCYGQRRNAYRNLCSRVVPDSETRGHLPHAAKSISSECHRVCTRPVLFPSCAEASVSSFSSRSPST